MLSGHWACVCQVRDGGGLRVRRVWLMGARGLVGGDEGLVGVTPSGDFFCKWRCLFGNRPATLLSVAENDRRARNKPTPALGGQHQ
jgi:hypothetical protein